MKAAAKRLMQEPEVCKGALPCPFCGGEAMIEFWHGGAPSKRMIACNYCDVSPSVTGETKAEALRLWNKRA